MRLFLVSIIISLILLVFPAISQGIHNLCEGNLVKIARPNDNDKSILTYCVTQSLAERFVELGWQVVLPESNARVVALSQEKAKEIVESLRKIFEEAKEVAIEEE